MKQVMFIITFVLSFPIDLISQDCCIPEVLLLEYERDVKHLALLRMQQLNVPEKDLIDIDQLYQDSIWEALSAVFHSESEGRDAVFDQHCIHHSSWGSPDPLTVSNRMNIKIDTSVTWYQNWIDENIVTNDPFIDTLIQKYEFEISSTLPILPEWFTVRTDQYINLDALADSLETHNSILSAERRTNVGGRGRIVYESQFGNQYLEFWLGWGDCPSGCINWHTWLFTIGDNCEVDFTGSTGSSDIPAPFNCNLTDSIPEANLDLLVDTFCIDEMNIALEGGIPPGGEYEGTGITNNILNPFEAGIGNHLISYSIESQSGCIYSTTQEFVVTEEGCLSEINEVAETEFLKLAPNPSNGLLYVDHNLGSKNRLEVRDLLGRLVQVAENVSTGSVVDLDESIKGVCFIQLYDKKNRVNRKIIVE